MPVLAQAVHDLPPGQAPALVRWVAAQVPVLERLPAHSALGGLLATCLEASRVELTTAVAMAAAVQGLVQVRSSMLGQSTIPRHPTCGVLLWRRSA